MTRTGTRLAPCLTMLALGSPLGCQKPTPTTAAAAAPIQVAGHAATGVAPPSPANVARDPQADVLSLDLATLNEKGYLTDAFFDFQKAELKEDARAHLARDAEWLRQYPSIVVLLESHCDDRGHCCL